MVLNRPIAGAFDFVDGERADARST